MNQWLGNIFMTVTMTVNEINTYGKTQIEMLNGYYPQGCNNEQKCE